MIMFWFTVGSTQAFAATAFQLKPHETGTVLQNGSINANPGSDVILDANICTDNTAQPISTIQVSIITDAATVTPKGNTDTLQFVVQEKDNRIVGGKSGGIPATSYDENGCVNIGTFTINDTQNREVSIDVQNSSALSEGNDLIDKNDIPSIENNMLINISYVPQVPQEHGTAETPVVSLDTQPTQTQDSIPVPIVVVAPLATPIVAAPQPTVYNQQQGFRNVASGPEVFILFPLGIILAAWFTLRKKLV